MIRKLKKELKGLTRKVELDNLSRSFHFLNSSSTLIHYWDHKQNWGDSINRFLFESILSKKVFVSNEVFNFKSQEIITGVGSILSSGLKNYSIWGSGFLSVNHSLIHKPNQILALRGKHTAKKIRDLFKLDCPVLGDPGLLFKEFYNPILPKKYSVGIIPHFKELDLPVLDEIRMKYGDDVPIISPTLDIFQFADQVKQCERILSSSLHGLILAESYGIPTGRIILSDRLIGGDFKFEDYYSGVGVNSLVASRSLILEINRIFESSQHTSLKDLNYNPKSLISMLSEYVGN